MSSRKKIPPDLRRKKKKKRIQLKILVFSRPRESSFIYSHTIEIIQLKSSLEYIKELLVNLFALHPTNR